MLSGNTLMTHLFLQLVAAFACVAVCSSESTFSPAREGVVEAVSRIFTDTAAPNGWENVPEDRSDAEEESSEGLVRSFRLRTRATASLVIRIFSLPQPFDSFFAFRSVSSPELARALGGRVSAPLRC